MPQLEARHPRILQREAKLSGQSCSCDPSTPQPQTPIPTRSPHPETRTGELCSHTAHVARGLCGQAVRDSRVPSRCRGRARRRYSARRARQECRVRSHRHGDLCQNMGPGKNPLRPQLRPILPTFCRSSFRRYCGCSIPAAWPCPSIYECNIPAVVTLYKGHDSRRGTAWLSLPLTRAAPTLTETK